MNTAFLAPSALAARLTAPGRRLDLTALTGAWFHQTVTIRLADAADLAADPAFPGRLRGAIGHVLMAGASAPALRDQPCPWDPPCAYDLLFREQARIASGLIVPRPLVLSADPAGRDLAVSLTLFGFACDWLTAAAEALTAALRHGIEPPRQAGPVVVQTRRQALAAHQPGPPPDRLRSRSLTTADTVDVPAVAQTVALDFVTPAALRGSADLRDGLAGFIGAALNRIIGLARWQDAEVDIDRPALLAAADRIAVDATGLQPVDWRRGSAKQDRWLPMAGVIGTAYLDGPLAPLLPVLALGALVHVGARTTFGQGRYRLRVIV